MVGNQGRILFSEGACLTEKEAAAGRLEEEFSSYMLLLVFFRWKAKADERKRRAHATRTRPRGRVEAPGKGQEGARTKAARQHAHKKPEGGKYKYKKNINEQQMTDLDHIRGWLSHPLPENHDFPPLIPLLMKYSKSLKTHYQNFPRSFPITQYLLSLAKEGSNGIVRLVDTLSPVFFLLASSAIGKNVEMTALIQDLSVREQQEWFHLYHFFVQVLKEEVAQEEIQEEHKHYLEVFSTAASTTSVIPSTSSEDERPLFLKEWRIKIGGKSWFPPDLFTLFCT